MLKWWRFAWAWFIGACLISMGASCPPKPPVPPEPDHNEACQALLDSGMRWAGDEPVKTCSSPEDPRVHNPTQDPKHCEEAPKCAPSPLPQPQCALNPDGSPKGCGCWFGQVEIKCGPPPPDENMWFPIVPEDQITAARGNPGNHGTALNRAMADLTGCAVGQEPCPVTMPVDLWFQAVCVQLHSGVTVGGETVAFNCGFHIAPPLGQVCPPGGGCSDQISIKRESFCDGNLHENYRPINPQHDGVRWAPFAKLDAWNVDCTGATWPEEPGTTPPPVDPPTGDCPAPHPDMTRMKFKSKESGNHLDTTLTTVNQEPFCREIGMSPMDNGVLRGGCPVRPECGHDAPADAICHDRAVCEAELCDQKWECNGQPVEGWRGNPAQTDCVGHYKTWCSAPGSTAVLEGDR